MPLAAPLLNEPKPYAVYLEDPITLLWLAVSGATTYRVQVAADAQFKLVLLDVSAIRDLFLRVQDFSPGHYHWRVRGRSSASEGDWSAGQVFLFAGRENPDSEHVLRLCPPSLQYRGNAALR